MTTRQLLKLAKLHGWELLRHGGNHYVYSRNSKQITIPYAVKSFVGVNIANKLRRA